MGTLLRVPGDGNCLFTAIALGYHKIKTDVSVDELKMWLHYAKTSRKWRDWLFSVSLMYRDAAVANVCRRGRVRAKYQPYMLNEERESYCAAMNAPGSYGGELEISVLSDRLRVPIIVTEKNMRGGHMRYVITSQYGSHMKHAEPIVLRYSRQSQHYDVVV